MFNYDHFYLPFFYPHQKQSKKIKNKTKCGDAPPVTAVVVAMATRKWRVQPIAKQKKINKKTKKNQILHDLVYLRYNKHRK